METVQNRCIFLPSCMFSSVFHPLWYSKYLFIAQYGLADLYHLRPKEIWVQHGCSISTIGPRYWVLLSIVQSNLIPGSLELGFFLDRVNEYAAGVAAIMIYIARPRSLFRIKSFKWMNVFNGILVLSWFLRNLRRLRVEVHYMLSL